MRKTLNLVLAITMGILAFPINTFALKQDVGVKVKGDISISAVTTISSDITIDVANKTKNPAYIELQNKSTIPLDVKVTDIEALSDDAPSTFVANDDAKDLIYAGVEDTKNKIGFSINDGQDEAQYIMPDTEIDLGVISASPIYPGAGGGDVTETLDNGTEVTYVPYSTYFMSYLHTGFMAETYDAGSEIYELNIDNGYAWAKGDLNFYYGITMVVGAANENFDTNPIPELGIDGVKMALLRSDIKETFVEVFLSGINGEQNGFGIATNPIEYVTSDGELGESNVTFLGHKVRREMEFDEASQTMVEVDGGEVYGTSYFYQINLNDELKYSVANSTKQIYFNFNFYCSSYGNYYRVADILTNKSVNK